MDEEINKLEYIKINITSFLKYYQCSQNTIKRLKRKLTKSKRDSQYIYLTKDLYIEYICRTPKNQ